MAEEWVSFIIRPMSGQEGVDHRGKDCRERKGPPARPGRLPRAARKEIRGRIGTNDGAAGVGAAPRPGQFRRGGSS